ncbi:MAG: hypothetical protein QOJ99_4070, partial [Bryobacterales bacterium]|nr:hypothetical protein [Bryobacterales bacterium]
MNKGFSTATLFQTITLFSISALLAVSGFAQSTNARLEGTVQDQSGSVVPKARVEALNINTQSRAEVTTDGSGTFLFPNLAPGIYTLTAEANGFRKTALKNVELTVSGTVSQIIKVEIGQTTETVNVEASALTVQTTDSQVSSAVLLRDIEVLPQLGRSPITLAIFQPGVQIDVRAGQDSSFSHVNGLRQGSNNAKLDGIDVNDSLVPRLGLSLTANNSDSVGEFRVVTEGGKAEYGRSAGGQVEMITKSGTNQYHGNAYDFLRNTALNANDFFNNQSGGTVPKLIQNIFGASFGGPIMKNKFFIFGNYQGQRTQQEVIRNRTVYTESAKAGIFKYKDAAGNVQSYDFGKADPRGIGPDAGIAKLNALYPASNNSDVGDGLNTAGFRFNNPVKTINDQFTIRGDYHVSSTNVAYMRWSWFRTDSTDNLNNADATYPGQPQGTQGGHRWGYAIGDNWTITPSLVNEFTIGHQSASSAFNRPARPAGPCLITNLANPDVINCAFTQGRNSPVNDITDNLTKVRGNHTFKGGTNVRSTNQYGYNYAGTGGAGVYPNVSTGTGNGNSVPSTIGPAGLSSTQRSTFDSLYNDILGRVDRVIQSYFSDLTTFLPAGAPKVRNYIIHESGYFFQDDWKINPRLTLNLGLRYEYFGVPFERDGLQGSIDQTSQVGLGYTSSNLTVVPKGKLYNTDWNNFAPRVGFAFDPKGDGKTAIRGNWGMFYDRTVGAAFNSIDSGTPGFSANSQVFPNQGGADVRYGDKYAFPAQPAAPALTPPATRSTALYLANSNLRTGYVMSYGLNIQHEIARNTIFQAGYIGNRGVKLFMDVDVNQPRIYGAFQNDFRELAANLNTPANVSSGNLFVKVFGTAASAISAVGSTNITQGRVGTIVNTIDVTNYAKYTAGGVSNYYFRNYPQFTQVVQGTNSGRSSYDSLQISLQRSAGALQFRANYTWSKSIDNISTEGNGFTTPIDSYNLALNRARSDFDRPHSLNISAFYTIPFGKGQQFGGSMPRLLDTAIGGWQIGALQIAQSGQPFSVSSQRATVAVSGVTPGNSYANYAGSDRTIGNVTRRGDGVYYFSPTEVTQFSYPDAFQI